MAEKNKLKEGFFRKRKKIGEIRILMICRLFLLSSMLHLSLEAMNPEHSFSLNGRKEMWQSTERKFTDTYVKILSF